MSISPTKLLLQGIDTTECAYYLRAGAGCAIDFLSLTALREQLRHAKVREPAVIALGDIEFLLHPYGSSSGYPLVMSNSDFHIQFGEFNAPSFFVRFSSEALWRESAAKLHDRFMQWSASVGLIAYQPEGLSRVDFTFHYQLPEVDFDEDSFISLASKDANYREDRKVQTFQFGMGDVVLRVYNKIAEIEQSSHKTWFYDLWGCSENVWCIEWQARKALLHRFGVRTFDDLAERQGDVLRYLASEHDSLRVPNDDSNRSRWPLHPLWEDLQEQIKKLSGLGVYREIDPEAMLDERLIRIGISMYGYLKRLAAIHLIKSGAEFVSKDQSVDYLKSLIMQVHDPMTWRGDVKKRADQMRLGQ